jgi:hypothetical protein
MQQLKPIPLKKSSYWQAFFRSAYHVFKWKLFRIKKSTTTFLHYRGLTLDYGNTTLKSAIEAGQPFAAVRIGAVEMGCLNNYEKILLGLSKTFKPSVKMGMKTFAGFFPPNDKNLTFYAKHFFKESSKTDILGISGIHMETYMYQRYFHGKAVIPYEAFEPLRGNWIQALKGKKVLIVSPFAKDIERQYARRESIFPRGVLPEFKLLTVKAIQTIGDQDDKRYSTWFEALDAMKVEIMKHDFDIALVGAGAYGSHLCWFIKAMHKQAIQTGGATQTMFGIMGRRWQGREHVSRYVTDAWIRPSEKPLGAEKVEHGAYW